MDEKKFQTGFEAGLTGEEQIKIALQTIVANNGKADMQQIYKAVESQMAGAYLSEQGKASLRFFINKVAVKAGYVYSHNKKDPGWRITPEGKEYLESFSVVEEKEEVVDVDTGNIQYVSSVSARGAAFELYILGLLKKMYPYYTWYHQGQNKRQERGLDFIGNRIGEIRNEPRTIGVQVKFHSNTSVPSKNEWMKFLAGCYARRIDCTLFITSGRLTGEQRREAGEANIIVIEGKDEIKRISQLYGIEEFELFE
jgi:hypothetical protein